MRTCKCKRIYDTQTHKAFMIKHMHKLIEAHKVHLSAHMNAHIDMQRFKKKSQIRKAFCILCNNGQNIDFVACVQINELEKQTRMHVIEAHECIFLLDCKSL